MIRDFCGYSIHRRLVRRRYPRNGNVGRVSVVYAYDVRDATGRLIVSTPRLREAKAEILHWIAQR
jgi:hypothetical protein